MKKEIIIKKYISEKNENTNLIIDELLKNKKDTLLIGSTGIGKTVAFIKAMSTLSNDYINIFLVPNRNQALQLQNDTKHFSIVGGIEYNDVVRRIKSGERIFFCVYDKAELFRNMIFYKEFNLKYNLVIDEAHCLIQDYYRKEAINKVMDLKDIVDSCILTTATPDILIRSNEINIKDIIEFKREKSNEAFKDMTFINYNKDKKETLYEALASYILSLNRKYDGIQIRVNDTKFIKNFSLYFSGKDDYIIYDVDSSQKDFNGEEFYNELYDNVIRKSTFPYESSKINIYLHTSLLDAGTNISTFKGDSILTIYVLNSYHSYNLDSIAQCLNRIRFPHDCCIFSFGSSNEEQSFKSYASIRNMYTRTIKSKIKGYNQLLLSEVEYLNFNLKTFDEKKIELLDFATGLLKQRNLVTGRKYSEGCLYYDEMTYTIKADNIKTENQIYTKYQNQYYFCRDNFIHDLEILFEKEFDIITVDSLKAKHKDNLQSSQKYAATTISSLKNDDFKNIFENKINENKKILSISKSKLYTDLYAISEINKTLHPSFSYLDLNDIIDNFKAGISLKQQREDLEFNTLQKLIKDYKAKEILFLWRNYDEYKSNTPIRYKEIISYIRILKHSVVVDSLNDIIYDKEGIFGIITDLGHCNSISEINDLAYEFRIRNFLSDFISDKKSELDDVKFIRAIFNYFAKSKIIDGKKEFKGTTINEHIMEEIKTIIRNTCKERYTEKQIIQTVKLIFLCKNENGKIKVRGIKKAYKSQFISF